MVVEEEMVMGVVVGMGMEVVGWVGMEMVVVARRSLAAEVVGMPGSG
jgi:hypothetical protein